MHGKIIKGYLLVFVTLLAFTVAANMMAFVDPFFGYGLELRVTIKRKYRVTTPEAPVLASVFQQEPFLPILMYHHVGIVKDTDDFGANDLTVSPEDFEKQVVYLKNQDFHSVSVKQAYQAAIENQPMPEKSIIFTFDDGYQDVFDNALPILKKYGFTSSLAIATELLGRPTYANWDEVRAASKEGNEILSHTENHLDLTSGKYSEADLKREIFGSKEVLEEKLGSSVDFFVYPYGKYNQKTIELISQAGYKMALTTGFSMQINKNAPFTVGRVRVHGQNGLEKLIKTLKQTA